MNMMFRIGEISKLFGIPQQTLRYYDKIGLFSPAHVNQETGYRYYTLSQLQQLHHIKVLKSINLSIAEIKNSSIDDWDLNKLDILYSAQIKHIEQSIEELTKLKQGIQLRQDIFKALKSHPTNEIVTSEFQERTIYSKAVNVSSTRDQETEYYKSFISLPNSLDYINVSPGFIVEKSKFLQNQFLASYLFLEDPSVVPEGFEEIRLPKGTYCSLYIEDSYSKSKMYYMKFKNFVKKNNKTLLSDVYEFCYTVLPNNNDISSWGIVAQINP
ncbi:MerR family transcriptional regulator [Paenibacillus sp. MMS20-IR301]|uniref:MerR family transcriptional regulator n=1 Tax=Paenibacillus sp. MMS20-IR301 TaxID=2895946 RepID=UPI0028ECE558|nr:MerR family transcriptional regulator [Paenibacillus sp. MMS20-IR301]WNS41783.1 MerR family transcriptional regulator [Paenibacillus sp. MMS20-IR301]